MAKHSTIYPSSHDLEAVQTLVSTVECALKHVSDWLDQSNSNIQSQVDSQPADSTEEDDPGEEPSDEAEDSSDSYRWASNNASQGWWLSVLIFYLDNLVCQEMEVIT